MHFCEDSDSADAKRASAAQAEGRRLQNTLNHNIYVRSPNSGRDVQQDEPTEKGLLTAFLPIIQ